MHLDDLITRRDFFAAHAPPVPDWFKPVVAPRPKRPMWYEKTCEELKDFQGAPLEPKAVSAAYELLNSREGEWGDKTRIWVDQETSYPLTPELKAAAEARYKVVEAWAREVREYDRLLVQETFVQWRWHYAEMMLRAAAGPGYILTAG